MHIVVVVLSCWKNMCKINHSHISQNSVLDNFGLHHRPLILRSTYGIRVRYVHVFIAVIIDISFVDNKKWAGVEWEFSLVCEPSIDLLKFSEYCFNGAMISWIISLKKCVNSWNITNQRFKNETIRYVIVI